MLPGRNVTLWCTAIALIFLGLAVAAAPKSAGPKKKSTEGEAAAESEAADTKAGAKEKKSDAADEDADSKKKVVKTDAEWRKILTPMQFKVARKKGTEPAFGPAYAKFKKEGEGTYQCVCCGQTLFKSDTKFDSGTGWPSFYEPIDEKKIRRIDDTSDGMLRIEVECSRCDGHLGHVFSDGPPPTGERFCMNYASLKFVSKKDAEKGTKEKDGGEPKTKGPKPKESK
jgi:peptide-methionine (R)-S-oxide reductase